jgi:cytochrome d ubiquinol oxidase subunit II
MEYCAASLVVVSLFVYAVLFCIECGATLFMAEPELLGSESAVRSYINPAWETTNVFLVTAFISLIAFFPGAFPLWSRALIVPFLVFLVVMGARIIGMLRIFYAAKSGRVMRLFLFISSFAAPVVFAAGIMPFFLAGATPADGSWWLLAPGFAMIAFASTVFLSSSFFAYAERPSHPSARLNFLLRFALIFFLSAAFVLVFVLENAAPHIMAGISTALTAFGLLAVIDLVISLARNGRYFGLRLLLALALFATLFFGIAFSQLPYLIYPAATIFTAFTDPASAGIMLGAAAVAAVFLVPALALLYYLSLHKKREYK